MTGLDLLEILRKKGLKANVILLTSQTDVRIAAETIKHGALDYIAKNEIMENIGNIRNTILENELLKQTDPKTAKEIVDVYSSSQTVRDHIFKTSTLDVNNKLAISDLVSRLRVMMEKRTIACCDSCESFVHMVSLACPECGDHEVRQDEVLQHISCGTTDMKSEFTNEKGNLVCPKCSEEITSKGTHYKTLGVMNECAKKHRFMKPNLMLICSNCSKEHSLESSKFKTAHSYELKEAINRRTH
jgi:DNA-binding NarL/FixJ family response regulator